MTSRYNILYDVSPEAFDISEQRFRSMPLASIMNTLHQIKSNRNRVHDTVIQEALKRLEEISLHYLEFPVSHFSSESLGENLNLEQVVDHLLQPRLTRAFQYHLLTHIPVDRETAMYRQEGMKELVENPQMAKGLEDGIEAFVQLLCSVFNRSYALKNEVSYGMSRREVLKVLAPYNLDILQKYTAMVQQFERTVEHAESRPMQRLKAYIDDVKGSAFFQDIFPVFDVSYFKDQRISLDVTIGRNCVVTASEYNGAEKASTIPSFQLISRTGVAGFFSAFFKMLSLPSTFAMDAMNTVVQKNIDELLRVGEMLGPLEFYTSGAGFYRRMKEIGMPVQFPTILPREERKMFFAQARNPLLLYQKDVDSRDVSRVIPNDIIYSPEKNMFYITGPNNGGKTCYSKTVGVLQVLAQNGFPVTAEGEASVSVVDGVYTHFASPDDIMEGEGKFKNEMQRVKHVFGRATPYSLVILDEPCSGTDHQKGINKSIDILEGFHRLGAAVYFTSHLYEVADVVEAGKYPAVVNLHAGIREIPGTTRVIRTYKIEQGRAVGSYGEDIAEDAGLTRDAIREVIEQRAQAGAFDRALLRK